MQQLTVDRMPMKFHVPTYENYLMTQVKNNHFRILAITNK